MIRVSADSAASQRAVFCVPHGGGGDGALWVPFINVLAPFMRALLSYLITSQRPPPTLGIRFRHVNFGGTRLVLQHALPP